MRVLLVEDDSKIASFIIKGLKAEGFAVDHAAHGENGLHLALTEPYDAAIIDVMLPRMDGGAAPMFPNRQNWHSRISV
jgi:DNA-binding response OmpR family regulator